MRTLTSAGDARGDCARMIDGMVTGTDARAGTSDCKYIARERAGASANHAPHRLRELAQEEVRPKHLATRPRAALV
jgi:hypothetical protein